MPEFRLKLEELRDLQKYEHQPPKRPSHLARRLTPPPARSEPPDLSLFLYAGLVLAIILVIMAIPYVIGYLFEIVTL